MSFEVLSTGDRQPSLLNRHAPSASSSLRSRFGSRQVNDAGASSTFASSTRPPRRGEEGVENDGQDDSLALLKSPRQRKRSPRSPLILDGAGGGPSSPSENDPRTGGDQKVPRLNLNFDPTNPAATQAIMDEIERTTVDPRILQVSASVCVPMWVHRWADLRFFSGGPGRVAEGIQESVLASLRMDLIEAEALLREVQFGTDGGLWSKPANLIETVDDDLSQLTLPGSHSAAMQAKGNPNASVMDFIAKITTGSATPFWQKRGASIKAVEELVAYLRRLESLALQTQQLEKPMTGGIDGTQIKAMPNSFSQQRRAGIHRQLLSALLSMGSPPAAEQQHALQQALSIYDCVPLIHSEFLEEPEPFAMDPDAIKDPDMLSPPQSMLHSETGQVRKVVRISVNFLRLRDHPCFLEEHRYVSDLLDAFEAYQLLSANLMPNIRSRHFYEDILRSDQQAAKSSAKLHKSVISAAREMLAKACEVERSCLRAMMDAWSCIQRVREATQTRLTTLTFSLRRRGDVEMQPYSSGEDVLLFAPVISDMDAVAVPAAFPQIHLAVHVFARTSPSLPPQPVGMTASRPLNSVFGIFFNETFELRTMREPTEMILHVREGASGRVVASIRVPASLTTQAAVVPLEAPIQYDGRINAQESTTGSASQQQQAIQQGISTNNPSDGAALGLNGVISIATTWTTAQGYTMEAIERMFLRGEADPLDPRHEALVQLLEKYYSDESAAAAGMGGSKGVSASTSHRVGDGGLRMPLVPVLDPRQKLLARRWAVATGEDYSRSQAEASVLEQPVPLSEHDALLLFKKIEKDVGPTQEDEKLLGGLRAIKTKEQKLLDWREKIRNVSTSRKKRKKLEDHELLSRHLVVPPLPTFRHVIDFLVNMINPVSKLNPRREHRLQLHEIDRAKTLSSKSSKITVHVLKAVDLPYRASASSGQDPQAQQLLLEPFVDVSFVGQVANTRVESGNNPSWFESLSVPFEPLNFEDETLALIDDFIVIAIYDKVQITLPQTEATLGAEAHVTHYRTEHRLLGSVKVPFYTLYACDSAHLEAQYPVTLPRLLMGYELPPHAPTLHLYISLWPPLHRSVKVYTDLQALQAKLDMLPVSHELRCIHNRAIQWRREVEYRLAAVKSQNPQAARREIDPFVANSVGDPTLACRFISQRGGPPPPGIETIYEAIRLVSLIPFASDLLVWDEGDVWSTCVEFLAAGFGDYEEHALLLLHLLRYIAPLDSFFLVIGIGDIFEQATYVLHIPSTRNSNDFCLIDPRTGDVFRVSDPRIAFSEVGMVVSHDNMYANVQLSGTPYRMVWDLSDRQHWCPLFFGSDATARESAFIDCVQRERLTFPPVSENRCALIEDRVKKLIRKNLKAWRRNKAPMFQERIGQILKDVLIELERERREKANMQQDYVMAAHRAAIAEFSTEYTAVGMPVCAPYKDEDFEELIEMLSETSVHDIGTDNVRYALGVYAYAYTGASIAVWAYLVALLPTERRLRI
jgi:hypothetical protein